MEFFVFEVQKPPFACETGIGQFHGDGQGLGPVETADAGIAFFHRGTAPDGLVLVGVAEIRLMAGLYLGFLDADHIRAAAGQPVPEALLHHGPQAVDVPTHQYHEDSL